MKLDGWGSYGVSQCPLMECDFAITWAKDIDTEWLEARLMDHVANAHTMKEWVREVVGLQHELYHLYQQLGMGPQS